MKQSSTKSVSTIFARGVVYLVGLGGLSLLTIFLPEMAREEAAGKANPPITWPFFVLAFIFATPFFIALYQTLKLLQNIDKNKAFSAGSIQILQKIKMCSFVFSIMIVIVVIGGLFLTRIIDPTEDAAPLGPIGFVIVSVSSVITVFVAVLQRLLTEAVAMKSENDLIV